MIARRPRASPRGPSLSIEPTADQRSALHTVLVCMPFQDTLRPSIQLGLLKAIGEAAGFPVRTIHANLEFATRIGTDLYASLCHHRGHLVGDWLFSIEAFGKAAPDPDAHLLDDFAQDLSYLGDGTPSERRTCLIDVRDRQVPAYLDALLESFPWDGTQVVGFSSTFQQNTASFALARRLKERYPNILAIFGGANFDGEMGVELVRSIDCIDAAVIGEGDVAFPALLDAFATGSVPTAVPGVAQRHGDTVTVTPASPPIEALDQLPTPDYDDYFECVENHGLVPRDGFRGITIPFESARGCWWGAKHHCTFCGLNGATMRWRAKSPQRVLEELALQARRYHTFYFEAVDNIIDAHYLNTLLPSLADAGTGYEFFYEVKANLSRAQLRLLAQSGVRHVQPGIESLSSNVLRLMRKGVRAGQNVNLLRWAQYYDIDVSWNLLWGFPGETEQDYAGQASAVPALIHLRPPQSVGRIWLERFSPMFVEPNEFPMRYRRPEASYRYIYPAEVDLERVAYFFEYELESTLPQSAYAPLRRAVDRWSEA